MSFTAAALNRAIKASILPPRKVCSSVGPLPIPSAWAEWEKVVKDEKGFTYEVVEGDLNHNQASLLLESLLERTDEDQVEEQEDQEQEDQEEED